MRIPEHMVTKHQAFGLVEGGYCPLGEAAGRLGLSYRQAQRWYQRYRHTCGSLIDFARIRPRGGGWNKTPLPVQRLIVGYKQRWPAMSSPHIADELAAEHALSVSPATVKRTLVARSCYHTRPPKRRVFTRFEPEAFGERLQMDTCSGAWLPGYRLIYLICVMDEYSRMIVGWRWVDADSVWNNMRVLRSVYGSYGLPKMLYTDNASMFKTIRHGDSAHQTHRMRGYETELQRAMRELSVSMFSHGPYQPQSKGKIERFFRFMQGRFIATHAEKTLDGLNASFARWVRWYNESHRNRTTSAIPKDRQSPSVWRPVSYRKLDRTLCFKDTRKVDKCNMFQFDRATYVIPGAKSLAYETVSIEHTPDVIRAYHRDRFLHQFDRITK